MFLLTFHVFQNKNRNIFKICKEIYNIQSENVFYNMKINCYKTFKTN